ncbi:type I toxin-antitoxin system SymE family toxin [Frischella perrara]|uniref:Type I toxin-antitoxin system SymE family toxin n=1 Tax=Frischella perrara TaxID=1267021 RepID=A0A318MQ95_FRIPE|nr:SymE family type I addiction module toxin [Frischella perrara]PXY94611.1 type I toxin-antitoxin system SymE family toxin [Frischella perrara]
MARTHSKLKSITRKAPTHPITEWFYTVGYTPNGGFSNPRPQLTIKGRWLEQIGFYAGQAVVIKVECNKLIIELAMQL